MSLKNIIKEEIKSVLTELTIIDGKIPEKNIKLHKLDKTSQIVLKMVFKLCDSFSGVSTQELVGSKGRQGIVFMGGDFEADVFTVESFGTRPISLQSGDGKAYFKLK